MMKNTVRMLVPCFLLVACGRSTGAADKTSGEPQANRAASTVEPADARVLGAFEARALDGSRVPLSRFVGKVALVVNTASECGYTPQYADLETLHKTYEGKGFTVLGFPSNDFGGQEPGTSKQIETFCKSKYGVTFPVFEKVATKGAGADPLYAWLGAAKGEPKWNFHKYLLNKRGEPVRAWPSAEKPLSAAIVSAIEQELAR